jgi:hypothetical protein
MSFELKNRRGSYLFLPSVTWVKALELAVSHDWEPQGVVNPRTWRRYIAPEGPTVGVATHTFKVLGQKNPETGEIIEFSKMDPQLQAKLLQDQAMERALQKLAVQRETYAQNRIRVLRGYLFNDLHTVTRPDALAFALALGKALGGDVPTMDTLTHIKYGWNDEEGQKRRERAATSGEIMMSTATCETDKFIDLDEAVELSAPDWFSGPHGHATLRSIIALSQESEFVIF